MQKENYYFKKIDKIRGVRYLDTMKYTSLKKKVKKKSSNKHLLHCPFFHTLLPLSVWSARARVCVCVWERQREKECAHPCVRARARLSLSISLSLSHTHTHTHTHAPAHTRTRTHTRVHAILSCISLSYFLSFSLIIRHLRYPSVWSSFPTKHTRSWFLQN